jgi:hypothetical protein
MNLMQLATLFGLLIYRTRYSRLIDDHPGSFVFIELALSNEQRLEVQLNKIEISEIHQVLAIPGRDWLFINSFKK